MSRLGPEARALLYSAREMGEPDDESLARVRSSLMARVGVATATAGTIGAIASTAKAGASLAPAASIGAASVTVKVAAAVAMAVVVGLGAGGVAYEAHVYGSHARSTPAIAPATRRAAPSVPAIRGPAASVASPPLDVAADPARAEAPARAIAPSLSPPTPSAPAVRAESTPVSRTAPSHSPASRSSPAVSGAAARSSGSADDVAPAVAASPPAANASPGYVEDVASLREAQAALVGGDALQALRAAAKVDPHGPFAEEREGIQILARCELGDGAARSDAARFVGRHPGSPLSIRLQAACSE